MANEEDLVAQIDYPSAGVRVSPDSGKAINKEQQGLLDTQNERGEYEGLSPLAMGLLQAGASMMRSGGWRNTPMTTSEAIGYAIPEGIRGYYNQDIMNQQEEAEFYAREEEERGRQQVIRQQELERNQLLDIIAQVHASPLKHGEKTEIISWLKSSDPETRQLGLKRFEKLRDVKSTVKQRWEKVEVTDKDGSVTTKWVDLNAKGAVLEILTKTAPESITRKQLETIYDNISTSYPAWEPKAKIILGLPIIAESYRQMNELVDELPLIPSVIKPEDYKEKADAIYNLFKGNENYIQESLDSANIGTTEKERYENLQTFAKEVDKEGWKRNVQEGALDLKWDKFEFDQEKYGEETQQWQIGNKQKLLQQAIENKWKKEKIQREIKLQNARIGVMQKDLQDGFEYLEAEDFQNLHGGKMPADAHFAIVTKEGEVKGFTTEDYNPIVPPKYSEEDMTVLNEELDALYNEYPKVFDDKKKRAINITKLLGNPADALKEAHNILTEENKLITPPASIIKKYQSDIAVIKNAEEALAMLKDEKLGSKVTGGTGFIWGRVTEKFKNEFYQKFAALSTMAALTKRHELIGSQMTDGELRFTESIFPSPQDTLTSARVKLTTLLADAKYNVRVTRNMFSEDAGYNSKIWGISFDSSGTSQETTGQIQDNYDADFGVTDEGG